MDLMITQPVIGAEESIANIVDAAIPIVLFVVGGVIACVSVVFVTIGSIKRSAHLEESRREIAAYVAEGSISPDDASKLLSAAPSHKTGLDDAIKAGMTGG